MENSWLIDAVGRTVSPNYIDWTLGFEREQNVQAYGYWKTRCGERTMPARGDLDPVAMRKFSGHVGLIELRQDTAGSPEYFIRRAGSRWEDVYGPITGKTLCQFLPADVVPVWHDVLDPIVLRKLPLRLTTQVDPETRNWFDIEMLIAPLGENERVTMLFVCFVSCLHKP